MSGILTKCSCSEDFQKLHFVKYRCKFHCFIENISYLAINGVVKQHYNKEAKDKFKEQFFS